MSGPINAPAGIFRRFPAHAPTAASTTTTLWAAACARRGTEVCLRPVTAKTTATTIGPTSQVAGTFTLPASRPASAAPAQRPDHQATLPTFVGLSNFIRSTPELIQPLVWVTSHRAAGGIR